MAEADVSKMTNGEVKLNGDHAQARVKHFQMASSGAAGPESTHCRVCSKRVYEMEKLVADGMVYHKNCFKCCKCTRTLRVGTYASMDAQIFCKPHFIECFKQKGNYEEGFGKERHKNKWLKSEDGSENEAEDHPAVTAQGSKQNCTAEVKQEEETITAVSAPQPSHSAPSAAAEAPTCVDAVVDGDDARGAGDEASNKSKAEPVVVSVSEKKSKFIQAVAESAKPKEHKPEPGKLKINAWTGRSDVQHSSSSSSPQPRRVLEGLGTGKSAAGISDKKSLFESASTGSGAAAPAAAAGAAPAAAEPAAAEPAAAEPAAAEPAAAEPAAAEPAAAAPSADAQPAVALRPRRVSPTRSSESWRRSASVDDYDGRWSHSSHKSKATESAGSSAEPDASGERQSRSTTRAPPGGSRLAAASAAVGSSSGGELSIVEQKRRAFQQRQNTEPAASSEKRSSSAAAGPLSPGGSLKSKMEEFERRSAEQAEAARRESRPKSETESDAKQEQRTSLLPSPEATAAHPPSHKHRQPTSPDETTSPVAEAVVLPSAALHVQLECSPPPVTGDTVQYVGQPHLAAVPEAADEDTNSAAAGATTAAATTEATDDRRRRLSDEAVGDDDCFEKPQDARLPTREISSIRSRFESGGAAAEVKGDAAGFRSAAREEIDVIRGSSPAGSGGAKSRYERALEETSRKVPPKQQSPSSTSSTDQTDSAAGGVSSAEQTSAEVASLKSRFESGVVTRDDSAAGREEAAAVPRPTPSSGTARLRYQKALEDSSTRPVPKSSSTPADILPRGAAAAGAEESSDAAAAPEHGEATSDGDAKSSSGADSSKRRDVEFQPVAISSLKSRFEGGAAAEAASESSSRAIDAEAAVALQGANVLARYKKALEESASKPIVKTEAVPPPTPKAASLRVRGSSSTDASADSGRTPTTAPAVTIEVSPPAPTSPVASTSVVVGVVELAATVRSAESPAAVSDAAAADASHTPHKAAAAAAPTPAAAAAKQPTDVIVCPEEKVVVTSCQAAAPVAKEGKGDSKAGENADIHADATAAEIDVAAGEPAPAATAPNGFGQRERKRPADIELDVKDGSVSASSVPAKSPSARSPSAVPPQSSSSGSSSQIHRLMNKFQPHVDAQPPPAHGGGREPKPLKIPGTFEGSRTSADGGDAKAAALPSSITAKSTKSLKERFEGHEHAPSSSSRAAADVKHSSDDATSSSTGAGGLEDADSRE